MDCHFQLSKGISRLMFCIIIIIIIIILIRPIIIQTFQGNLNWKRQWIGMYFRVYSH